MLQATLHTSSPGQFAESTNRIDGSVETRINNLLQASPYLALRTVLCRLRAGVWILQGRVPNYFLIQMAHREARSVGDDLEIRNEVEVRFP